MNSKQWEKFNKKQRKAKEKNDRKIIDNLTKTMCKNAKIKQRLAYLKGEIQAERISTAEISELQSLAEHIDKDDTLLLQWAGVCEHCGKQNCECENSDYICDCDYKDGKCSKCAICNEHQDDDGRCKCTNADATP